MLLDAFRAGKKTASDELFRLYRPLLMNWAHGRIPAMARSFLDTADVVQDTLVQALRNKKQLKAHSAGEFFCYLRQILINQIKQELRKNKPFQVALTTQFNATEKLAYADDINTVMAYDAAIEQLNEKQRQAVVMRIEFGLSHQEIADLTGRKSADAARVYIARAIKQLGQLMTCQNPDSNTSNN